MNECELCGAQTRYIRCSRCEESECAECGRPVSAGVYYCGPCAARVEHDGGLGSL